MKIAITGASGFIGNELVIKHLERCDSVRILTRNKNKQTPFPEHVQIVNCDLSQDSICLVEFVKDIDVLYHCAAEVKDESKMYNVNVAGTQQLINAASGRIKHWVQLSSTGVYGKPSRGIITEETPPNPQSLYEKTKLKSDELVLKAGRENKFSYTILRPSNVFGIRMRNQSLYQFIKAIDNGLFFFIGEKGASANYISVENIVTALTLCGQKQIAQKKIYILSDWETMENFVAMIVKKLKKPVPRIRLPKFFVRCVALVGDRIPKIPLTSSRVEALTDRCRYCTTLIEKELDYSHCVSMEEGLTRLISAYKRRKKSVTN